MPELPDNIIIVVGTPRSGTSMTAGLVHKHGAWVGSCRPPNDHNPRGFFENVAMKKMLKTWHQLIVHKGIIAKFTPGWREAITAALWSDGYRRGPLVVKHSALYSPIWAEFNPYWITCWRDSASIIDSCKRSRLFGRSDWTEEQYRTNIELHHSVMRKLWYENPSRVFPVHTQELACGNYEHIEKAINGVGLKFSKEVCDEFVNRDYWHFKTPPRESL